LLKFSFVSAKNWVKLYFWFCWFATESLELIWFSFFFLFSASESQKKHFRNKSLKHRHFVAGQFLSRSFVVLLRKSIPQNRNLKTAA